MIPQVKGVEHRRMVLQPFGKGGGPSLVQVAYVFHYAIDVAPEFIFQALPRADACMEGALAIDVMQLPHVDICRCRSGRGTDGVLR